MLYIITEDKNSARDFWECVFSAFKKKDEFRLVPLPISEKNNTQNGGNTTLQEQVTQVFTYIKKGDELLVVFDNIGNTKQFSPTDFLNRTKSRCVMNGIKFMFTTYYCFEELYLSYDELLDMFLKSHKQETYIGDTLKYVNDCINNNIDYFNNDIRIQNFITARKEAGQNREHFANQLLIKATEGLKGYFKILKEAGALRKQGMCWIVDCCEIQQQMGKHQVKNVCEIQCQYCCRNRNSKDKLIDLNNRSILRKSKLKPDQI